MFLFYVRLVVKNIFALVLFNVWIRVFEQYFRVLFIRHDKKKKNYQNVISWLLLGLSVEKVILPSCGL